MSTPILIGGRLASDIAGVIDQSKITESIADGIKLLKDIKFDSKKLSEDTDSFVGNWIAAILGAYGVPEDKARALLKLWQGPLEGVPVLGTVLKSGAGLFSVAWLLIEVLKSPATIVKLGIDKVLQPNVGAIGDIINLDYQGFDKADTLNWANEAGFNKRWFELLKTANRTRLDINNVQRLYNTGIISKDFYRQEIKSLGFTRQEDVEFSHKLGKGLLSEADLFTAFRRGLLLKYKGFSDDSESPIQTIIGTKTDSEALDEYIRGLGYVGMEKEILKELSLNILSFNEIVEAKRRNLIDDKNASERFKKLGYSDDDSKILQNFYFNFLDPNTLTTLLFRGKTSQDEVIRQLQGMGLRRQDALQYIESQKLMLTPSDTIRAGVREAFTPEIAEKFGQYQDIPKPWLEYMAKVGYFENEARLLWAAHWDLPAAGQMFDMFHRGIIDNDELNKGLRALDVMPFWRDKLIQTTYELIPRRSLALLVNQGLLNFKETIERYKKLGYNPQDSLLFTQSLFKERDEALTLPARTEAVNAYIRNDITAQELKNDLISLGFTGDKLEYYLMEAEYRRLAAIKTYTLDADKEVEKQAKDLSKAEILKIYRSGLITKDEAKIYLTETGYGSDAIDWLLKYEDYKKIGERRQLLADNIEKRVKAGVINFDETTRQLIDAGFAEIEARNFTDTWKVEIETKLALQSIPTKEPTKADIEKWFKLGIIDTETWVSKMFGLGYAEDDILFYLYEINTELEGG
jgi:hypothetical protein